MKPTVRNIEIPVSEETKTIMKALRSNDSEASAYIVGGFVRDFLMGMSPKDEDITTNLTESDIIALLTRAGISVKEKTSLDTFGVVFASINNKVIEVAPFRKDIGGDGRRPESIEYASIFEDAMRRDLTINNLYYDIERRQVLDFNTDGSGLSDIENRRVRMVGNPCERFNEDQLRVLRFVRFFCRFNSNDWMVDYIDDETKFAIEKYCELNTISAERIQMEFFAGLLQSQNTICYLNNLAYFGLMRTVFPGCEIHYNGLLNQKNPAVVLAWMLRHTNNVENKLHDLKYPREIYQKVGRLQKILSFNDLDIPHMIKCASGLREEILSLPHVVNKSTQKRIKHIATYVPPKIDGYLLLEQGFRLKEVGVEMRRLLVAHYNQSWSTFNTNR